MVSTIYCTFNQKKSRAFTGAAFVKSGSGFRWWRLWEDCRYANILQLFWGVQKCWYVGEYQISKLLELIINLYFAEVYLLQTV